MYCRLIYRKLLRLSGRVWRVHITVFCLVRDIPVTAVDPDSGDADVSGRTPVEVTIPP